MSSCMPALRFLQFYYEYSIKDSITDEQFQCEDPATSNLYDGRMGFNTILVSYRRSKSWVEKSYFFQSDHDQKS